MRWIVALLVTGGLVGVMEAANAVSGRRWPGLFSWQELVVMASSAIWAAFDAGRLQGWKYKGGVGPAGAFFGVLLLWLICLPLYLVVRAQLRAGELPPKEKYRAGLEAQRFQRGWEDKRAGSGPQVVGGALTCRRCKRVMNFWSDSGTCDGCK